MKRSQRLIRAYHDQNPSAHSTECVEPDHIFAWQPKYDSVAQPKYDTLQKRKVKVNDGIKRAEKVRTL